MSSGGKGILGRGQSGCKGLETSVLKFAKEAGRCSVLRSKDLERPVRQVFQVEGEAANA